MDRNREARRGTMAASNGLPRRRHRSSSLRDSPDEDAAVELQETARLRDRGSLKKDRDRDRERDRLSRSKRRRGDRSIHGNNREDGDDSSEESVNDDEDEEDEDGGVGVRMIPQSHPVSLSSSSLSNHHRKSFPPPAKVFRAAPTWKAADEMIGVSVPRKARSASTKRSHECWVSGVGVGEPIHRQASTSPVRTGLVAIAASPAPVSPTSSNASARKKMKPNGSKQRPPKSSSKSSSSAQDEIEIEIAEVLYGMMRQPLGPSKQDINAHDSIKFDSRDAIKSSGDTKSRVSSPISNSPSVLPPQSSSVPPQNSGSAVTHVSATAPKRKRPRPVKYEDENPSSFAVRSSPVSSTMKAEIDHPANIDSSFSHTEKISGSAAENGGASQDLPNLMAEQPVPSEPQPVKLESHPSSKTDESESRDVAMRKEEPQSPRKETSVLRLDDNREITMSTTKTTKASCTVSEIETQREEKFQIDLMAPPPSRSSPDREGGIEFVAVDPQAMVCDVDTELKDDRKICKDDDNAMNEEKAKVTTETAAEIESQKMVVNKDVTIIDLHLDLEKKTERDNGLSGNKPPVIQKQPSSEKTGQAGSVSLPMSVASWPGGLPPMGYMAPLQGVVSMDGSDMPPVAAAAAAAIQPPNLLFTQPRPKRCATHCYIARNICYHQQFTRMNPFWPAAAAAAAGSASLYGPKACNLNILPSADVHPNIPGKGVHDKAQGVPMFPGHAGKDKASHAANMMDASQRKQMLLQHALPPGAPSNILHGPAFIFPLSQQQAAAAAAASSARPGSVKSPPAAGNNAAASSGASGSASAAASASAAGAAAMSFNYPSMPGNETQYLAILQNNAYPFPIPAHVGPPAYRGSHGQAMPFFSGSFYSSQMLHPSQIQSQQLPTQSQQSQQGHQNTSMSSGSSSSQKQLQSPHQRQHGNGSSNLQGFPTPKNQPTQQLQLQQRQQQQQQRQHHHQQNLASHQARQLESEMGGEDSPSTADSRVSRASVNIYGQNFAMPIHPQNFALMTSASAGGAIGNPGEKKQQQQLLLQGSKSGIESLPSPAFAMSFASVNGATANGIDISSFTQNHAILQSLPEATRHGYQIMAAAAAAQAAQQKKSYRFSEEGKGGSGDASNTEEERKAIDRKSAGSVGQSIAFSSRPDLTDTTGSTLPGNTVIDSSARALNLDSTPTWASSSVMPATMSSVNAPSSQQQLQRQHQQQHQQQQQMIQLQKQHQFATAAVARSKTPSSNGNGYLDHLPSSSSMASKFPTLSSFPQNLVQSSNSPTQSPQWKNSGRTTTSQTPSPSLASSTSSTLKNLPQQHSRTQQNHTQISFAANSKSSNTSQVQQIPSNNQSSSPVMVGSPTTSSMSKGAGGSPRTTTSTSAGGNKTGQASTLSSHQVKNSSSVPSRKSSPVGGRNVPSILGHPHTSSIAGTKSQLSQQQQQAQLLYSNFIQSQAAHSSSMASSGSTASGYYLQRRRAEQQQQQQGQGSAVTSSSGMLSLSPPVSHANSNTADPAKAGAAAMKPSQGLLHAAQFASAQSSGNPHQLVPAGFPYGVHTVSTAVQVKPAEKKQPAGE